MSMSLTSFEALTANFPDEKEAILRIANLIEGGIKSPSKTIFSTSRIISRAGQISTFTLASVLQQLEGEGILKKIIRLTSKDGIGIQDYTSLAEIPDEVLDRSRDVYVVVEPEDLQIYYQVLK